MEHSKFLLEKALKSFLTEDVGYGDITTDALVDADLEAEAVVVCKEAAVVAGLREALILLELVGCQGTPKTQDGNRVASGVRILTARGPARSLLTVERTMLNLISHMSGVSTATADLVAIAKKDGKGSVKIASTRKTLPGLRYFEKKAVELGGGDPHRLRLDDAVLIKENHLALTGSLSESVRSARSKVSFTKKIEVEATDPNQAVDAAEAGADIILLDNMKPEMVKRTVALLKEKGRRDSVVLEASGGIQKENLASYAKTGVDVISVGAITHSAKSIDMSMEISKAPDKRR